MTAFGPLLVISSHKNRLNHSNASNWAAGQKKRKKKKEDKKEEKNDDKKKEAGKEDSKEVDEERESAALIHTIPGTLLIDGFSSTVTWHGIMQNQWESVIAFPQLRISELFIAVLRVISQEIVDFH